MIILLLLQNCSRWDDDLTKTLKDTEEHMKEKCKVYFVDIKNQTVEVIV